MLREELVSAIARRNPHLARGDVETVLASVLETIDEALAKGDRIMLTETGSFSLTDRQAQREAAALRTDARDVPSAIVRTLDAINDRIESIL